MTAAALPSQIGHKFGAKSPKLWSPPESDLSCREAEFLATLPFRDCFIITEEATGNVKPNIWQ